MDDATLKTIENAVVICSEHSKNSANNATTATNARQQAEKLVAGIGETEKNVAKQAQRAEDAVEATDKAQKAVAEYVDVTFPTKVGQAEKRLAEATTKGVQAVTDKATQSVNSITSHTTTIIGALDTKKTAIETSIDAKAQAANTAIDGKVTEANDAKTEAVKAKGEAEGFKGDAEKSAKSASESAEQASKSAQQAEDAKDAIGDVGERLDAVEGVAKSALPMGLGSSWADYKNKTYNGNVLSRPFGIPAPKGFIFIHCTNTPYAWMQVEWIKPNGERVSLALNATTQHPWMSYSGNIYCGWMDGEIVYVYAKSPSGDFYKASIPFNDGSPSFDTMTSTKLEKVVNPISKAEYCIVLTEDYLITNKGEIFNANTLEKVASVTLQVPRIVKPSSGEGVLARTSSATVRITLDFDEEGKPTPATTNVNTQGDLYPLASGYFCSRKGATHATYSGLIACGGGVSNSWTASINGNIIPIITSADFGRYVVTLYGIFEPTAEGISTVAVGVNIPRVLFANPLTANISTMSSFAVSNGEAFLIYSNGSYVLVSREDLV